MEDHNGDEQDRQRFHNGQAWFEQGGKGVPIEEVLAEFGLKSEDFHLDK